MKDIVLGTILDFILGDPYNFPHPVKLMGNMISFEERVARNLFHSKRGLKLSGFVIVLINISIGFILPYMLLKYIKGYRVLYSLVNIYIIYTCIAARSLHYEGMKVKEALSKGIEEARHRLSYIVGRDTTRLEEKAIIRATVETVAENTSDGVIAPLFYIILFGAPGGIAYKFINTMDSMLGYMDDRYIDIGYFPAKVDDIFNYIPARLTALFMILSSIGKFDVKEGKRILFRDRDNHKSPNSGYPESAVAGLLGIQLGGDNFYHGVLVKKPTIGDSTRDIVSKDIESSIEIMYRAEILFLIIYVFFVAIEKYMC
ncbi:MAG: adenosylcobinamide-phosphate synthase CbiB [Tissierellaceae bacterium]